MIGSIIGGIAGVAGSLFGADSDNKASEEALAYQKEADARMEARLQQAYGDIDAASQKYIGELTAATATFNPLDISREYDAFYDDVIVPLQREYDEFVDPALEAAYSGGVMGADSMQSGAFKAAQAKSSREEAGAKTKALAGARSDMISRNYAEDARKREIASAKLGAATLAPNVLAGHATTMHEAESSTIAAQLAAKQQGAQDIMALPGQVAQGVKAGSAIDRLLADMD